MKILKYCAATFTILFLSIAVTTLFAGVGEHKNPAHWEYEGELGPDHWSEICGCKIGERQSPIGISITEKAKLDEIVFNYYPTPLRIINNGHTIQFNYGKGSYITIGHRKYELMQFHFHTPSEHVLHGKHYDMEVHLVHKGAHGELAVVGIFMEAGRENDFIRTLWSHFPKEQNQEHIVSDTRINAQQILPKNTHAYYNYAGSLTTPPCTENVNWLVLKTPIDISQAEVNKFASLFKYDARPVQHVHGRVILENE